MAHNAQDPEAKNPKSSVEKSVVLSKDYNRSDKEANKPVPGQIYYCRVIEVLKPNESVVCGFVDGTGKSIPGECVPAIGIFGSLLGFKTSWLPPRGTHVIVYYTGDGFNYILGAGGSPEDGDHVGLGRSATTPDRPDDEGIKPYGWSKAFEWFRKAFLKGTKNTPNNRYNFACKPDYTQVEGELEIGNQLGVAQNFTRHMASLKANDLAKIECHLVDDMVRIISQTYKHFNALGDYKIYNDGGRLNVRWDGTNVDWELYGNKDRLGSRSDMDPEEQNVSMPTRQLMEEDARWRFSQFVGFLGDFINIFISDPAETVANHPHVFQQSRTGKGRVHINEDGSMLLQTVSEIGLEKVCRISVPLERKPEYHPDGDKIFEEWNVPEDVHLTPPKLDPLKVWDFAVSGGKGGVSNAHYNVYQIRRYVKWFSNKYCKAQFLRLDKDWSVPSEADCPEPDLKGQKQEDKTRANNNAELPGVDTYATIRIQKDGSILLLDAYDNSVVLSKGGVQLASTNNVQIEAAGSINMTAGRDINMVAKNNVDINAIQKGVSIRSKTFFQQYCQSGGILFETDQSSSDDVYDLEDKPRAEHDDSDRIQGIYFKTKNSSVRVEAGKDIGIKATQGSILAAPARDFAVSTGSRFQVNDTMEIWNSKSRSATSRDFNASFKRNTKDPDSPENDLFLKLNRPCSHEN